MKAKTGDIFLNRPLAWNGACGNHKWAKQQVLKVNEALFW